MFAWRRCLVALALAGLGLAISGKVRAGGGVIFLDDRDLTVRLAPDAATTTAQIDVLNATTQGQSVTLELTNLADDQGNPLPAGALPAFAMTMHLGPNAVGAYTLTFQRVVGLSPRYSGRLTAHGDDGSFSRLSIVLLVQSTSAIVTPTSSPALDPNFVSSIAVDGSNLVPSILFPLFTYVRPIVIKVAEPLSQTQALVGGLSSGTGELAQVWQSGQQLVVRGAERAGNYTGRIDLQPGTSSGKVALTLHVRDTPVWALVALILGLGLTTWLEQTFTVTRPLKRLELTVQQLKERAVALQSQAVAHLPAGWPYQSEVIRIYDTPNDGSLLEKAGKDVLAGFGAAATADDRKQWGPGGSEIKAVAGYLDALPDLYALSQAVFEYCLSLESIDGLPFMQTLGLKSASTPAVTKAKAALKPELLQTPAALADRQAALQSASVFVKEFRELSLEILRLNGQTSGQPEQEQANRLLRELYSHVVTDRDILALIREDAHRMALSLQAAANRPIPYAGSTKGVPAFVMPALTGIHIDLSEIANRLFPTRAVAPKTSLSIQAELRRLDLTYKLMTAVVVLATGLYTLYLPNATFGSWSDYLSLLLWGTTVSGGFQVARRFLPDLVDRVSG